MDSSKPPPPERPGYNYCPHGWDDHLWGVRCTDCRLIRIEGLLDRLLEIAEYADAKQRNTL
jgi:hypothetical protein